MSYQALARKWRPKNFTALVGQEHVVRALNHALTTQHLHHAYLFTGTRGVGKTTLARILAKSINCERGITAQPCGQCSACQEIDAGRFVDLLEVDAATNTRVEEMRQLLENAVYAPTRGRFKVYVIDEVHMLSTSAFNAMLKTLEEPPEHVKFILATTDPQKIPVTVLSRCLQFNLKQMTSSAITEHLAHVLNAEAISYEEPALRVLAQGAAGSMRDALSLLDQAIAHGAGQIALRQVRQMLGAIDSGVVTALLEALAQGDLSAALQGVEQLDAEALSFASALHDLAARLTEIQLMQFVPGHSSDEMPEKERLEVLAGQLSRESVQLAYQIVIQGRQELPLAPDEKSGFIMVMLRLFAFVPSLPETMSSAEARVPVRSENSPLAGSAPIKPATLVSPPSAAPPALALPDASAEQERVPQGNTWGEVLGHLSISGMVKTLAQHCELRELDLPRCLLRLPPVERHLLAKAAQEKLQQALSAYWGQSVRLEIEIADVDVETPAAIAEKAVAARAEGAMVAIEQDAFVQEVSAGLGGTVVLSSIQAI